MSNTSPSLGKLAIPLPAPFLSAAECVDLARRAEDEWGYPALWLAETGGADSFALAGALATATQRVDIGTAIEKFKVPAEGGLTLQVLAMDPSTGNFGMVEKPFDESGAGQSSE